MTKNLFPRHQSPSLPRAWTSLFIQSSRVPLFLAPPFLCSGYTPALVPFLAASAVSFEEGFCHSLLTSVHFSFTLITTHTHLIRTTPLSFSQLLELTSNAPVLHTPARLLFASKTLQQFFCSLPGTDPACSSPICLLPAPYWYHCSR